MSFDGMRSIPENYKTDAIGIDSYDGRIMSGRICSGGVPLRRFSGVIELLELMKETIDSLGFPDAYDNVKTFSMPAGHKKRESRIDKPEDIRGELATFTVKVLFRQNTSWQGIITWVDGRKEETFRSVYEMLMLMDSALQMAMEDRAAPEPTAPAKRRRVLKATEE